MLLLSAAAAGDKIPAQPDYIALAMVAVMFLILIVMTVRKYLQKKKAAATPAEQVETVAPAPTAPAKEAPGSAGHIKLHDVDPKTAAMLMAIVADKTGTPLNELRFISIKEVK